MNSPATGSLGAADRVTQQRRAVGRPAAAGNPGQLTWQRRFDDQDRLAAIVDPSGRETRFEYAAGVKHALRITKTSAEGSQIVWEFDEQSRLVRMIDAAGRVAYDYDDLGRLDQLRRDASPTLTYAYDTLNRITALRVGNFYELDYTYDFLGRLTTMTTPGGTITYEYLTGQGLLIRTLPNKAQTIWEFEPNGQLRQITHVNAKRAILAEYTYEYRPDGLIAAIGERSSRGAFTTRYAYDKVGRLIRVADLQGHDYTYEYDQLGNRLRATLPGTSPQAYAYDWAGRLISANQKPSVYDTAGNLSSITLGETELSYRHNSDGRLLEAGNNVVYGYDGGGKLIERRVGPETTTFMPNPFSEYWQPLVIESKRDGRALLVWDNDTPLMIIRDGKPEYLLHDHLGSVRLAVDGQGKVKRHIDYDPFGLMLEPTAATDFAPRFAGLLWDVEAQTYLTLARAYLPVTGQFLGPDPQLRLPDESKHTHSLYAYCGGDPVNFVDRDGAEAVVFNKFQGRSNNFWQARKVWWGAFWRDLFGNWGLPVNKGYEREAVIRQVIDDALREAHKVADPTKSGDVITKADELVRAWRANEKPYPRAANPTPNEWQAAENYMYARKYVETGKGHKMFQGMLDTNKGIDAAVSIIMWQIPLWTYSHFWGERSRIDPDFILRLVAGKWSGPVWVKSGEERWIRQTDKTIAWQNMGVWEGLLASTSSSRLLSAEKYEALKQYQRKPASPSTRKDLWDWPDNGGGGPGGPGGGGPGGPGGGGGSLFSKLSPSTVGGVYLGGSGQVLAGIGQLEGLALDSNNNLILLSKTGGEIGLPPLRLDDVVTVFRSVYIYGEGPTVTIDPNPADPEGAAMIIQHGKATENTYVGWILYQADRLMKGYTIGVDNISTKEVSSAVSGYQEVLDALYFDGNSPRQSGQAGRWERFWIVPASARRFAAEQRDLTLFDVPLKVKTQLMKWQNGKLVNDLRGRSSTGALTFIEWFTKQYDAIAREQYLTPPSEFGITGPVPVFTELRRIALMTALAEKLRDQGTPMPFWMRDYKVEPVAFDEITPGLRVTRSNGTVRAQVFGGVALSPESKAVKQLMGIPDLKQLPKPERQRGEEILKRANTLSETLRQSATTIEPLKPHQVAVGGDTYDALSLPGSGTYALAPARLEEVDMVVPVDGEREIRLVRSYHSFFEPSELWGKGWTLDLPQLQEVRVPVERKGDAIQFRTGYELLTPLNRIYVRFSEVRNVPALNNSQLQVPDTESGFFGLADGKPPFLTVPTKQLLSKNGQIWHFTEAGSLAAVEQDGFRTVFVRQQQGTLSQIVGLLGTKPMATIDLHYDGQGRLVGATGKNVHGEQTIRYEYDASEKLSGVLSDQGKRGYRYEGSWVSTITWQDAGTSGARRRTPEAVLRRFEYNRKGQLIAEVLENGKRLAYSVTSGRHDHTVTVTSSGASNTSEVVRYDGAYRPLEARYPDGTQATWTYSQSGESVLNLQGPEGEVMQITESADGRHRTFDVPPLPQVTEEYDAAGRLTAVTEQGWQVLRQDWYPQGKLKAIAIENSLIQPQYGPNDLMTSVLVSPPEEKGNLKHWQKTELDHAGRTIEITDYRGLRMAIQYDHEGNVAQVYTERDGKNYGFEVSRDTAGRVQTINSSWGKEQLAYAADSSLAKVIVTIPGRAGHAQAALEFASGRLRHVKQFDGGEIAISYHSKGPHVDLPKQVTYANGLSLTYRYDASASLMGVDVGTQRQIALDYDIKGRVVGYTSRPYVD